MSYGRLAKDFADRASRGPRSSGRAMPVRRRLILSNSPEDSARAQTVSEFIWKRLADWELRRVFGYSGHGVGGLDVARENAEDYVQSVQARHEEMVAFKASAHAKFTGEVGLCYATSGPGAIHLLNGLYDAIAGPCPRGGPRQSAGAHRVGRTLPTSSRFAKPV